MAHVTGDWNPLGDVFYRKVELYAMDRLWQEVADLRKFKVAVAPFGGPIALMRDSNKITQVRGSSHIVIFIFSAAGKEISRINWDSGNVIHIGWSLSEDLLCIQDDGTVLVYNIFGKYQRNFNMGQESRESKVIESKVFHNTSYGGTGVAVLTGTYRIYVVNDVHNPASRKMMEVPGQCKTYCEFDTSSQMRPRQLVWCGTGAVVGYWENLLLVIGPQKDWIKYNMDTDAVLIPENDSLHILQTHTHELLQRVPGVVEDIFKIGSMAPGAMLYEACREFQKESQKADEYIRMIKDQLSLAVEQCIEAAGAEYEPNSQKLLLRAASFGKCFGTNVNADKFVNMCKLLRVLNAVRDYQIGIPLTYDQLKKLTLTVLMDRLILRRQWALAQQISQYLKLPESEGESRILGHWACYKVEQKHIPDELIAQSIKEKLGDTPGIAYSEIAKKASECGRTQLAVKLLEYEPRAAEQVPLLMTMRDSRTSLRKAIESGDTDLVYMVLLQLKEDLPRGEFLMMLRNHPQAQDLFLQLCREQHPNLLLDLYNQNDNFQELANTAVRDSLNEKNLQKRLDQLNAAQDNYKKAANEFSMKATEEEIKLLGYQQRMQEQYKEQFLYLSLHDTVHKLVAKNLGKMAEQLRKEFKFPDKRFWWLKIDALAGAGEWIELERFAKSKKSPIGYEPFVELCMKHHNKYEANKYAAKVAPEHRVKMYIRMGTLDEAAELAFQQKSEEDLNLVLRQCAGNRQLSAKINTMKQQLGRK
eukprot:XP_781126.3 PREDICTED: vacuolar protein sorting-associated protein 16 homolog [Strongylocentrotus purpuratus]